MPNVNKTYIEDQNTARSYEIQAVSKAFELGSHQEGFGEVGNKSHVVDEPDVLRLRPRPTLTEMPSSVGTKRKPGIVEHTYFGVRDLLSESSSQSSVTEDLIDNAVNAINSEAECDVPILQGDHDMNTNARSASYESLQHTYLDTRDLQEQPCNATLYCADQTNISSVTKINEKEEGSHNPAATGDVDMNGQGHVQTSLSPVTDIKCFEGGGNHPADQSTNIDEYGYLVLDEKVESCAVEDCGSQKTHAIEASNHVPKLARSVEVNRPLSSFSFPPLEEDEDEEGINHTYLELADLLLDPLHAPSSAKQGENKYGVIVGSDSKESKAFSYPISNPGVDEFGYIVLEDCTIDNILVRVDDRGPKSPLIDDMGYLVPSTLTQSSEELCTSVSLRNQDQGNNILDLGNTDDSGYLILEDTTARSAIVVGDGDETSPLVDDTGYLVPSTLKHSLQNASSAICSASGHGQEEHATGIDNEAESGCLITEYTSDGTSKEKRGGDGISHSVDMVDDWGYLVPSALMQPLSKEASGAGRSSDHDQEKHPQIIGNTDEPGYLILDDTASSTLKGEETVVQKVVGNVDKTTSPVDDMGYLVPRTSIQSLSKVSSAPSMTSGHGREKHSLTIGNTDDSGYPILDTTNSTSKKDGVGVQISPHDDEGYLVPDMVFQPLVMSPRASYTKDHDHDSDSAAGNTLDGSLQDYDVGSGPKSPLRSDDENEVFLVADPASCDASISRSGYDKIDKEEGKHGEDSEIPIP